MKNTSKNLVISIWETTKKLKNSLFGNRGNIKLVVVKELLTITNRINVLNKLLFLMVIALIMWRHDNNTHMFNSIWCFTFFLVPLFCFTMYDV